jgi:hypothetical protein
MAFVALVVTASAILSWRVDERALVEGARQAIVVATKGKRRK